jgi:trimeric autotransporter adhesin
MEHLSPFLSARRAVFVFASALVCSVMLTSTSVATSIPPSYRDVVLADAPSSYWRLGESLADWALDETDAHDARYQYFGGSAPVGLLGRPGALADDPDTSIDMLGFQDPYGTGRQHLTASGSEFRFSGRTAFTLEAWVNPRNLNSHTRRVFSGESVPFGGTSADAGYLVGIRSDGLVFSRFREGQWSTLKTPLSAGRWAHVVATYDGQTMRLFVDGALRSSRASSVEIPDREVWFTMGSKQGYWKFYAGGLDEAAVYPHALSPARVAAHYSSGTD